MSSNIRVIKICEFCKNEFIAKKTTSKTCSDNCAKRLYKLKIKNGKIARVEIETEIKRTQNSLITEDQIRIINAKEYLSLKEAALLLNITPLTLRRWTLAEKIHSQKIGKKHLYLKANLFK